MDVPRDELERAVRATLSRQAATLRPLAVDPAGLAIRRANRTRRRRTLAGVALAGAATVLVSAGMAQFGTQAGHPTTPTVVLGDPRGATAAPAPDPMVSPSAGTARPLPGPGGPAVDLIVGTTLRTTQDESIPLGLGAVDRAQRVPDQGGWLVVGGPTAAGRTLVSMRPDGSRQALLAGAEAIAVAATGRQVAWRDGDRLTVAGIVGDRLVAVTSTAAPGSAVPVGFVGDAVVVRLDPTRPGYAVWRPAAGGLSAGTGGDVLAVYGTRPDGRAVGVVATGSPRRPCLALLDPARNLAATRTACGPVLGVDGFGGVSADGRWLLVNGRTGASKATEALLVDLATLDGTPVARRAGPALTGAVAWTPAGTAWYVDGRGWLVQVRSDRVTAGKPADVAPVSGVDPGGRPVVVTDVAS
ncbi:hypothetical protein C5N14_15330 [Micromonospora sp. MW-13]|uniref:hypothetical protein n=1 Tax=Micromonospora sp. MW-13 TaxID=2094022 RepID=UPI000E43C607|nr:hypothetical protein [Micromonospora sp. MW-13]RGC68100.1 hypothetical protein C5N14_15330 [Micromonospora sp. MW-13]